MSKSKTRSANNRVLPEYASICFWLIICFVTVFLIAAPFNRGLFNGGQFFFEQPIYTTMVWSMVALFVVSIYLFSRWKLESHREIMSILIWIVPLFYLISMINAASHQLAINELYIHVMCMVSFLIGAYYSEKLGSTILQYGLVGSGYILVIHGFLNWLGNVHYKDAVLGDRLSGVFQYPNSYATYLTGILIACLILTSTSKKWYIIFANGLMLVPIGLSILLTFSRGGLVVLPIVVLIYLLFQSWKNQLFTLLQLILTFVASLSLLNFFTEVRTWLKQEFVTSLSIKGWLWLIGASVIISVIVLLVQRFLIVPITAKTLNNKVFHRSNFWIPITLVVVIGFAIILILGKSVVTENLPSSLKTRIETLNIENRSIATRAIFIKDSISLAKDYPIIGAGGGAWTSLYDQYKTYPYLSNQTHTVFMQYLVETGFLGLGVVFIILIYIIFYFLRFVSQHRESDFSLKILIFPIFSASILIHSLIDFDMSFVYLSVLVFLGLGVMASTAKKYKLFNQSLALKNWIHRTYPICLAIVAIVLFVLGLRALNANMYFSKAVTAMTLTQNYNDFEKPINSALKLQPNHPDYALFKVQVLIQLYEQTKNNQYADEIELILQRIQKFEPYNKQVINQQYEWLIAKNDYQKAIDFIELKLELTPWDQGLYEKMISVYFNLGNQARLQGANKEMKDYWEKAKYYLDQFNKKLKKVKELPVAQQRGYDYEVTPDMALPIGQIYYIEGNYSQVSAVLKPVLSSKFDISINRDTARWYLASLQKQNKKNRKFFDKLISSYPEEKEMIEAIVNKHYQ